MGDNITGRTQITAEQNQLYNKTMLERAHPLLIHEIFADVEDMPEKAGTNVMAMRRYSNLATATTPLTAGIAPAGKQMSQTIVNATIYQYGDYVAIDDQLDYMSQDNVLLNAAELLGDQSGETYDEIIRDAMHAGTNVQYANARTTRDTIAASTDKLDSDDFANALMTLKLAMARHITQIVDPSNGYNTTPIRACFPCIVHPRVSAIVKTFTGYMSAEKYSSQTKLFDGEIGSWDELRIIETTKAKVFTGAGAGGIDVYSSLIIAQHAYCVSKIIGRGAHRNIVHGFDQGGPLEQVATSGWKGTRAAKITNDAWIIRVEGAVS